MTEATAPEVCLSSVDGHLLALFEAAQRWIHEQGLVLVEIESILGQSGKLLDLYQGRLTAEKQTGRWGDAPYHLSTDPAQPLLLGVAGTACGCLYPDVVCRCLSGNP